MHYLYILKSNDTGKYYVGESSDVERRFRQHLQSSTSFGKRNKNLSLIYKGEFVNRSEAKKVEYFIKRQKSRSFIERFIKKEIIIPR